MTDFIARVAARAVGERAAAFPRVPALFEAPAAAAGSELEVIDQEVVVPAADRTARGRPAPGRSSDVPASSAAPPLLPGNDGGAHADADAAPPDEPSPEPSPRSAPDGGEPTPDAAAALHSAVPLRTPHEERAPAGVAVAAPLPTPAVPIVARPPAYAVPAPAATPAEPPTVRVHIGRLEVRANLQEQARPSERTPAPRPQELSLSDYLRGRRERR